MIKNIGTQLIESDRLILRRFEKEDANDMLKYWISKHEVQNNYGEPVYENMVEVSKLLNDWIVSYEDDEFYRWAVISKSSSINIGQIAFYEVDSKNHKVDVEYCIGKEFWGNGYATEALTAVINNTFENTGFNRIQAFHRSKNSSSGRVLEKARMRYEGRLKQYLLHNGVYDDCLIYAILKDEWEMDSK